MPKKQKVTNKEPKEKAEQQNQQQNRLCDQTTLVLPTSKQQGHIFLFCGSMGSGKTTALVHCMYPYFKHKFFKFGVAFCPSKLTGDFDFLPDDWVHTKFTMDKIERYLDFLKDKRTRIKEERGKDADLPPSFLVLDDTYGSISWQHGVINRLIIEHRHLNLYLFITCQSLAGHGSSTALREWTNYAFLFKQRSGASVDNTFYSFGRYSIDGGAGKMFADVDDFVTQMAQATSERYRCMLLTAQIGEPMQMCYWKANETPKFKVLPKKNVFGLDE